MRIPMHSYAGFTAVRHYWLICCLIILFVVLLLLLLLVLCPLYNLTNSNDSANSNNNTSTLRYGGFRTPNCNKLNENPNSQQEAAQSPCPSPSQYLNPSVVDIVGGMDDGSLADHNNLPKSRSAAERGCGATNCASASSSQHADGKTIGSSEGNAKSRHGWRVNSGENSMRNISNGHVKSEIQSMANLLLKRRDRRFIILSGSGIIKFVMGVSFPITLASKQRSLAHFYNIQIQYPTPTRPIYWWNYFNSSSFAARRPQRQLNIDHKGRIHQRLKHDASRKFVYAAIEQIFERHGIPGESCLLQAICEVSQLSFYVPRIWLNNFGHLWHALLNAIFIPTVPNVDAKYLHASQAGRFGVDCRQTFSECPQRVNKWLRNVAHME